MEYGVKITSQFVFILFLTFGTLVLAFCFNIKGEN